MPQRFYPRFTACRDFPLFPACFLLPPICRNVFARALLFVALFLCPFRFFVADMPQRFCSSFAFCSAFPLPFSLFYRRYAATFLLELYRLPRLSLFPACFLLPPICRNAFARALLFVASFLSPFRFLSPLCAEVRSFALRFVPPLLVAFSRARALARFAVRAMTANRSALKKIAPLTDQEITLAAKNKLIRVSVKYANIVESAASGICRLRAGIDPPAHSVWKPFVRKPLMSGICRADCG